MPSLCLPLPAFKHGPASGGGGADPSEDRSIAMNPDPASLQALAETLGSDQVERGVPLAPMTTFRVGGPADLLLRVTTPEALTEAVQAARAAGVPHFLLGRGANILVGDSGFRGLVIRCELGSAGHGAVN